eukprot:TRINITY_DN15562_c0_g1_i1.p1 TRINITY_DN15562_c0_g1~~TRINITY_DN15562_c0_g1_i1.p1  ORF type:complete len:278 (+),score=67.01 TRINITY_DN15562_c0_g1_i1:69-902(+)
MAALGTDAAPGLPQEEEVNAKTERTLQRVWETSHVVGAVCLCVGRPLLRVNKGWEQYQTLASAGWLRGWAWSSLTVGGLLLIGSIVQLSQLPDTSFGSGMALFLLGTLFVVLGPALVSLGNRRLLIFMNSELDALVCFPVGCRVRVVADETPELGVVAGAQGRVIGHHRGRVGVVLDLPGDRLRLRGQWGGDSGNDRGKGELYLPPQRRGEEHHRPAEEADALFLTGQLERLESEPDPATAPDTAPGLCRADNAVCADRLPVGGAPLQPGYGAGALV